MSYSNPMHHDDDARAPIRRAPMTPDALAHWLERDGANCQQHLDAAAELRRMSAQRDALLQLVGRIHNNAAESPEWIRARIDETIVRIAGTRVAPRAQ